MCKIYVTSGINEQNREGHIKLFWNMMETMSEDYSHRDGIGYAAIDSQGNLFGERWLNRDDAINKNRVNLPTETIERTLHKFKGFLEKPDIATQQYGSFGTLNWDNITALTLHTRLATTGKEFKNTHPFVENDTSLIHNGVINNHEKFRKSQSTCDSEAILTQYLDHKVNNEILNFRKVSKNIMGYYACGVFSRDPNGNRILDIFKSSGAQLVAGYIKELDSIVFTSVAHQLKDGCKKSGLSLEVLYEVNSNKLLRFNPINGEVLDSIEFKDRTYSYGGSNSGWNNSQRNGRNWLDTKEDDYMETRRSKKTESSGKKKIQRITYENGKRIVKEYVIDDPELLGSKNLEVKSEDDADKLNEYLQKHERDS